MERKGHREGKRQAGAGGEEEVSPTSVLPSVTPRELGMPPRASEHGRAGSLLALCGVGRWEPMGAVPEGRFCKLQDKYQVFQQTHKR